MDVLLQSPLIAAFAAGLAAFLFSLAVGTAVIEAVDRRGRIKTVIGERRRNRFKDRNREREQKDQWREDAIRVIRAATSRMNVVKGQQVKTVRQRLIRAGYRARDAIMVYAFAKVVMPLIIIGAVVFYIFFVQPLEYSIFVQAGIVLAGGLAGSMLPDLWLRNMEDRRKTQIRRALPDALDLMVICAEAGLSLDASLHRVAGELSRTSPTLADEISYTCLELRFLAERRKAIESLQDRIDMPAIRALSSTLIQTEKYGTPLAQALRILAAEQRTERMLRAEEKAARLPAIMTVPLILFILPALFVVILGPSALIMMDTMVSPYDN